MSNAFHVACRRIAVPLWLTFVVLVGDGRSQQAVPDLSGTWKLNAKASKQGAVHGSQVMEIIQTGSDLKIRHQSASGDRKTFSYVIDGKESLANFGADGTTTAKTHWDGAALLIESHHHDNSRSFAADTFFNYRYSLSADQENLVVDVQGMRPPVRDLRAELVYQRQ